MTNNRKDHSDRLISFLLSLMLTRPASVQKFFKSGCVTLIPACERYSHASATLSPNVGAEGSRSVWVPPLKRLMVPVSSYLPPVGRVPATPSLKSSVHCSSPGSRRPVFGSVPPVRVSKFCPA